METLLKNLEDELKKNDNHFKSEISSMSIGRATPYLVEDILVDYYGVPTPLKQIATISITDPRSILIQPWDKGQLKQIEKAISLSQLGFNPINDGSSIRILVPQPTEERRKELVKRLGGMLEKAKISSRSAREDAIKEIRKMEKDRLVSEDEKFKKQDEIQKIFDSYKNKLEEEAEKKEKEIMTV